MSNGTCRNNSEYPSDRPLHATILQKTVPPDSFQRVAKFHSFAIFFRVARIEHNGGLYSQQSPWHIALVTRFFKSVCRAFSKHPIHPTLHHRGRRAPAVGMNDYEHF